MDPHLFQITDQQRHSQPAVLVVDDVPANLVATKAALNDGKTRVITAGSGYDALDVLAVEEIAVALIDVQMPGMDGFELATRMRAVEASRYVPIVFVTATARDVSRAFKGYEVGAVDYLYKPVDRHILRSKVATFLTLAEARRQLEEADRMRELFIAALGHDLRNPLASIMMAAELAMEYQTDDEGRAALERIIGGSGRVSRLVEQLLDATRFRKDGHVVLIPQVVDLKDLVRDIILEFELKADRFNSACQGDTRGTWDPDRLSQVLSNLVGNAVQHSPSGSVVGLNIDGRDPGQVIVCVSNQAVIPSDALQSLFEPFRRAESEGKTHRGLGLGLFITQQLVLAHGGAIDVDSHEGTGTAFTVTLPRSVEGHGTGHDV